MKIKSSVKVQPTEHKYLVKKPSKTKNSGYFYDFKMPQAKFRAPRHKFYPNCDLGEHFSTSVSEFFAWHKMPYAYQGGPTGHNLDNACFY